MYSPRFSDHLSSDTASLSSGDAFQKFVYELLLHDYPDLHVFPGGGKDGGIDLVQTTAQPRLVVECKYIGKDELGEALKRWESVAKNLATHLADPAGPTPGQAQYKPWYQDSPPISEYIFCVSSKLAHLEQFATLREEIEKFFAHLGSTHRHLRHLTNLTVTVLDWSDLEARLSKYPQVMFRWFPLSRPQGLVPLDEIKTESTFRSYLFGNKLEYYGRGRHLQLVSPPPTIDVQDEEALLRQLEGDSYSGLIVTGSGGIGKTRLTLELGYLARDKNWVVLRVLKRLKEDTLQSLVERIQRDVPVLLLLDYVETQRDFEELIESLNELNDTYNLRLRYIANCRTSYYRTIAPISRHHQVNLSPGAHEEALRDWLESYQRSAVRHILDRSGLEINDAILKVCHDLPVLAVFVTYLHNTGRELELRELLREEDFANWIYKRVQLSFGASSRELALFISLFPLSAAVASHTDLGAYGGLFDTLATDGWIEKLPPNELHNSERWEVAHDVLADQIVLSYFNTIPQTIDRYVHELFSLARRVGNLRSAFITLQRLADHPLVKSVNWPLLLDEEMREDPAGWRNIRDLLLRTPLLTYEQIIETFDKHAEVWEGAEAEPDFQNALGWLARWLGEQEKELGAEHHLRPPLISWIRKAVPHTSTSNLVLTRGLQFCPDVVRDAALNWITTKPRLFQTHYLMTAWLDAGLPPEEIAPFVEQWAINFSTRYHLSFLIQSWLDAGGDPGMVQQPMLIWLNKHQTILEAQFVYYAWLEAGGDKELVRAAIKAWLVEHQTTAEARFVYSGWLDAGGNKDLISDHLRAWLALHARDFDADFIYKAWLENGGNFSLIRPFAIEWLSLNYDKAEAVYLSKFIARQVDIPIETIKDILSWCRKFMTEEDALWRLLHLRSHFSNPEIAEELCSTVEVVFQYRFLRHELPGRDGKNLITSLFSHLISEPNFRNGSLRRRLDALLSAWLRHPASYGAEPPPHFSLQRAHHVRRVASLIRSGALKVFDDHAALERFFHWVNAWEMRNKESVAETVADLKDMFPTSDLWDIVKFE
ncbi:MAG TPA: hypothetical protein VF656_20670 [Pyrinomonadaceae bacterium]|jgi:hypothetical protein